MVGDKAKGKRPLPAGWSVQKHRQPGGKFVTYTIAPDGKRFRVLRLAQAYMEQMVVVPPPLSPARPVKPALPRPSPGMEILARDMPDFDFLGLHSRKQILSPGRGEEFPHAVTEAAIGSALSVPLSFSRSSEATLPLSDSGFLPQQPVQAETGNDSKNLKATLLLCETLHSTVELQRTSSRPLMVESKHALQWTSGSNRQRT